MCAVQAIAADVVVRRAHGKIEENRVRTPVHIIITLLYSTAGAVFAHTRAHARTHARPAVTVRRPPGPFVSQTRRRRHVVDRIMARTVLQQALAVYCCCCAMAALHLAPGVVAAVAGGGQHQRAAADTGHDGAVIPVGVGATGVPPASPSARNKRWSTTFGANSGNKNTTSKHDHGGSIL